MSDLHVINRSWQQMVTQPMLPEVAALHGRVVKFHRQIWWRNAVEYAACVIVIVLFGYLAITGYALFSLIPMGQAPVLTRIAAGLLVAGTFYVGWQLHRRGSAMPLDQMGAMPIAQFQRAQLERQRDAVASVLWWYLLPFAPGFVLMSVSRWLARDVVPWSIWSAVAGALAIFVMFAVVLWLNRRAADKLQQEIDKLDASLN